MVLLLVWFFEVKSLKEVSMPLLNCELQQKGMQQDLKDFISINLVEGCISFLHRFLFID